MNQFFHYSSTINSSNPSSTKKKKQKKKQMDGSKLVHLILWMINDPSINFQNSSEPLINT